MTDIYQKLYPMDVDFSDIAEEARPSEVPIFKKAQFPVLMDRKILPSTKIKPYLDLEQELLIQPNVGKF